MINRGYFKKAFKFFSAVIISAFLIFVKDTDIVQERKDYKDAGGEIVVVFNDEIEEKDLNSLINQYGSFVKVENHIEDYALLSVKTASAFRAVMEGLGENKLVLSAQANYKINILSSSRDTLSDSQWYINNPGYYVGIASTLKESIEGIDMDVLEAWEEMDLTADSGREVVVAVVDTGVDVTHPDLAANVWINKNEIDGDGKDNDNNGYKDDIYGWDFYNNDASVCHYTYSERYKVNVAAPEDDDNHGTHIAGIIAAQANNDIGIAGVASNINIKIMTLKINGGKDGTGSISDAIEAIKYATMMGADICNLSWGTTIYDVGLETIMRESDMLFVAAAGNTSSNASTVPIYPSNYKLNNLISVTAVDSYGDIAAYSNYGTSIDLAAPGDDIISTIVGTYASMSGSSMAVPQVSAIAAMLYSISDNLYASNVKEIIIGSIKPLETLSGVLKNPGIPSAYKAVMASGDLIQDTKSPVLSFKTVYSKDTFVVPVNVKDTGGSSIRVTKWMQGKKTLEDFKRGIKGNLVINNRINISEAGTYSFYSSDYAGNETVTTYEVLDDLTVPSLITNYKIANDYKSRTVSVTALDIHSGLKYVKYVQGNKSAGYMLYSGVGTMVDLKSGKGSFRVEKDGTYTILAVDYRGNATVNVVKIKTVKAVELKLSASKKTISPGEQYVIKTTVKPSNSTDSITFTSSNEKVATVSSSGKITAKAKGKAVIKARTSSGLTSTCKITVK